MSRTVWIMLGLVAIGPVVPISRAEKAAPAEAAPVEAAPAEAAPPKEEYEMRVHPPNLPDFDPVSVSTRLAADQIQTVFSMVDTGNQQFTNGNYFAAVHAFKVAEATDPGNLTLLKPLGRACVEAEFFDHAVAALEPIRATNAEDAAVNAALVRAYAGLLDMAMFDNEFELAEALLAKILAIEPEHAQAKPLVNDGKTLTTGAKVEALRRTAAALREKRRNPIAAERLERLIALAPQDYDGLVQLADIYGALRLYDQAETTYRSAIAIKESPEEDRKRLDACLWGQARFARDLKEYPRAIASLEKLRAAHPEDTNVLVELAKAFLGADEGRPDRAVPTVLQAKALVPNSAQVAIALAEIYKASDQLDMAIASLAEAAPASDNPGLAFNTLGKYHAEIVVEAEADRAIVDKAIAEKTAAEKVATEKTVAATGAAEKAAAAKLTSEAVIAEKAATDQAMAAQMEAVEAAGAKAGSAKAAVATMTAEKAAAEAAMPEKMELAKLSTEKSQSAQTEMEKATAAKIAAGQALPAKVEALAAVTQKSEAAKTAVAAAMAEKTAADGALAQKTSAAEGAAAALAAIQSDANRAGELDAAKTAADQAAAAKTEAAAILAAKVEAVAGAETAAAAVAGELEKANAEKAAAEQSLAQQTAMLGQTSANAATAKAEMDTAVAEKTQAETLVAQKTEALAKANEALTAALAEVEEANTLKAQAEQAVAQKTEAMNKANETLTAVTAEADAAAAAKAEADRALAQKTAAIPAALSTTVAAKNAAVKTTALAAANEAMASAKGQVDAAQATKAEMEKVAAEKTQVAALAAEQAAAKQAEAATAAAAKTEADAVVVAMAAKVVAAADAMATATAEAEQMAATLGAAQKAAAELAVAAPVAAENLAAVEAAENTKVAEKTALLTAASQAAPEGGGDAQVAVGQAAATLAETQKAAAEAIAAAKATADQATAARTDADNHVTEMTAAMKAAEEKVAAAKELQEKASAEKAQAGQVAAEKAASAVAAAEQAAAMKVQANETAAAMANARKAATDNAAALDALTVAHTRAQNEVERLGAVKARAGQDATHEAMAARAAESGGSGYAAYKSSGLAYVAAKQWSPALQSFGEGLKYNPAADTEFLYHYGLAYFNMPNRNRGALDESVKHLARATELEPGHLASYSLLGDVYTAVVNPPWTRKAIQALEKAAELSPEDPDIFSRLGKTYARERRSIKAYAAYARAVELAPDNQEYLRQYIQALVDDNRFDEALKLTDGKDPAGLGPYVRIAYGRALIGLARWEEVRALCAELKGKTEDKKLLGQIDALDGQAKRALDNSQRVGGEKLVVVLFGEGAESAQTWRDPERDAIPHLWNDLMARGELREAISLEDRYLPEDIATGIVTGQWRPEPGESLTYYQHVRPTLMHFCAGCHNDQKAKGDFAVDDPVAMLEGGEDYAEKVVVAGKSADSYLLQCIIKGEMPPKEPLRNARIVELLKKWIDQGAVVGEPVPGWSLHAPSFLERYRAARAIPQEKVWGVVGSEILDPLQASTSPEFGQQAAPAFVCVPRLAGAVERMQALLRDADERNLERPAELALIAEQTSESLGLALGSNAVTQLVTETLKRARYIRQADDQLVYALSLAALKINKPDVLFVAFDNPNEDSSPEDIRRADASVYALWNEIERIPEYRNNTNFIVITPMPRENLAYILRIGPRITIGSIERGEKLVWNRPVVLTDLMIDLAGLLAIDYEIPESYLKPD